MDFDLATMTPHDRYKLVTGLVVPRPIAFISTLSADGVRNAAPFSFFNVFGASPPVVVLGINRRPGGLKDSFANIMASGEFVINVATTALAEKLNATSGDYAPHVDEFVRAGLTATPSVVVAPPRIAESPAHLECRLIEARPIKGGPATLLIGEIVHVHVSDHLLDGTRIDQRGLDAIGRMGGPTYVRTADTFTLPPPVIVEDDAL